MWLPHEHNFICYGKVAVWQVNELFVLEESSTEPCSQRICWGNLFTATASARRSENTFLVKLHSSIFHHWGLTNRYNQGITRYRSTVACCCGVFVYMQITVFRMGSEGQQDIEMAILTALLKGIICYIKQNVLFTNNMFLLHGHHSVLLSFVCQAQMPQQQISSVWHWPGTEWILPATTSLFMDTTYQWV